MLQRPSKSKMWANDEEMLKPVEGKPLASDVDVEAVDSAEASDTQRKKAKVVEPKEASHHSEPEPMVVDHSGRDDPDQSSQQDAPAATQSQNEPVSDADWLRSKTSRLLGLLDDEEQAEFDTAAQQKNDAPKEAKASGNQDNHDAEKTPAQPKDADETDKAPEVDTNVELIRSSARLFVRNLPYDAKEPELGALFAPFGKVEEVSTSFYRILFCLFPLYNSSNGCSNDDTS